MKNKSAGIVFLVLIFTMTFSFFITPTTEAAGIVPCGRTGADATDEEKEPCELCDLIVGIKRIIDFGKNILVAISLTAIVIGGVMYIVSAGNEQMMQTAKGVLKQALIGMVIVLTAWLIINTSMWLLATKDRDHAQGGGLGINVDGWSSFTCEGVNAGNEPSDEPSDGAACGTAVGTCDEGTPSNIVNHGNYTTWDCDSEEDDGGVVECSESNTICGTSCGSCGSGNPGVCLSANGFCFWSCTLDGSTEECEEQGSCI